MRTVAARFAEEAAAVVANGGSQPTPWEVAMAVLRRLERRGGEAFLGLCTRYLALRQLFSDEPLSNDPAGCLQILRAHAAELAKQGALAALHRLRDDLHSLPEAAAAQRRSQVFQQLRRVAPGRTSALPAIIDSAGELRTTGEGMAEALCCHWRDVFAARSLGRTARREWLRADAAAPSGLRVAVRAVAQDTAAWRLRRSDVRRAIASTSRSAPGPDGVPYSAWRRMGALAVDVLHAAGAELASERGAGAMLETFPLDPAGHRGSVLRAGGCAPTVGGQHRQPASRRGDAVARGADARGSHFSRTMGFPPPSLSSTQCRRSGRGDARGQSSTGGRGGGLL